MSTKTYILDNHGIQQAYDLTDLVSYQVLSDSTGDLLECWWTAERYGTSIHVVRPHTSIEGLSPVVMATFTTNYPDDLAPDGRSPAQEWRALRCLSALGYSRVSPRYIRVDAVMRKASGLAFRQFAVSWMIHYAGMCREMTFLEGGESHASYLCTDRLGQAHLSDNRLWHGENNAICRIYSPFDVESLGITFMEALHLQAVSDWRDWNIVE